MKPKLVVPTYNEIISMTTEQLFDFRSELLDASMTIEQQIVALQNGEIEKTDEWQKRSSAALSHMRRGLATIKSELANRGHTVNAPDHGTVNAYTALDVIRQTLKHHEALVQAVRNFLEDDNDENFTQLERLAEHDAAKME